MLNSIPKKCCSFPSWLPVYWNIYLYIYWYIFKSRPILEQASSFCSDSWSRGGSLNWTHVTLTLHWLNLDIVQVIWPRSSTNHVPDGLVINAMSISLILEFVHKKVYTNPCSKFHHNPSINRYLFRLWGNEAGGAGWPTYVTRILLILELTQNKVNMSPGTKFH